MDNCIPFNCLKPANHCTICGRSFEDTGGHRIIAQKLRGVGFSSTPIGGGHPNRPYKSIPLNDSKTYYMIFWGEVGLWSQELMDRSVQMYLNNQHPYICSYCGKRTCSICGIPQATPVGSDYLTEDGQYLHSPSLGVNIQCVNSKCKSFQKPNK